MCAGVAEAKACIGAYPAYYWGSDFCWRNERDTIISGDSWSRGCQSAWGRLGIWVPDGSWLTSTGSEHRRRSSCLPACILLNTPGNIVQGDTGSHGRNPALIIPVSRRPWAPEKRTTVKGWIYRRRTVCLRSASLPCWYTYVQWLVYLYGGRANYTVDVYSPVLSPSFISLTIFLPRLNSEWWEGQQSQWRVQIPYKLLFFRNYLHIFKAQSSIEPSGKVCESFHLLFLKLK